MRQKTDAPGGGSTWYPLLGEKEYSTDRYVIPINRDELTLYSSDLEWDVGFANISWAAAYYEWDQVNASDYTYTMLRNSTSVANCTNWFKLSLGVPTTSCNSQQLAQFTAFALSQTPTTLYKPAWLHTFNSELRISSKGDSKLNWTVGAFIEKREDYVDSTLAVVDYKTGSPPSSKMVEQGFALQLGLLGMMAGRGGFEGISGEASTFEYWSLGKAKSDSNEFGFGYVETPLKVGSKRSGIEPEDFLPKSEAYLTDAINRWIKGDAPFTARLNPDYPAYDTYDQLMRLDEWIAHQDGGEDA